MRRQRGIALVLVLLGIAMLAAAGLGLSLTSSVMRLSAANYHEGVGLINAAEAALALAARELAQADLDAVLAGAEVSALVDGAPGVRVLSPESVINLPALTNLLTCGRQAPCNDAQVRQSTLDRPWGANNPRWRLFLHRLLDAPALPVPAPPVYVAVWIGDDAREEDDDPVRDGAGIRPEGRYIVRARAEAFGPRGGRRAVEAELARICAEEPGDEVCLPGSRVQSWRIVSSVIP